MERFTGILLILFSAACFGVMPAFAHFAYKEGVSVNSLLFFRFFIAFLAMLSLTLIKKVRFPRGKDLVVLMAMGLIGYAGVSYCYFNALKFIPASMVSALLYLYPVLVVLMSSLLLKTPLTPFKIMALSTALSGVFLVVGLEMAFSIKGICLALCAPLFYSAYIIAGAKVMQKNDVFSSSVVIIGASSLFYLLCSMKTGFFFPSGFEGSVSILAIALMSTCLAIYTFFIGMNIAGPVNTSMLSTFEPVTTVLIFYLFFGRPISFFQAMGTLLILASAVMVALSDRQKY